MCVTGISYVSTISYSDIELKCPGISQFSCCSHSFFAFRPRWSRPRNGMKIERQRSALDISVQRKVPYRIRSKSSNRSRRKTSQSHPAKLRWASSQNPLSLLSSESFRFSYFTVWFIVLVLDTTAYVAIHMQPVWWHAEQAIRHGMSRFCRVSAHVARIRFRFRQRLHLEWLSSQHIPVMDQRCIVGFHHYENSNRRSLGYIYRFRRNFRRYICDNRYIFNVAVTFSIGKDYYGDDFCNDNNFEISCYFKRIVQNGSIKVPYLNR